MHLAQEQLHQDFQSELQAAKEMTRAREKALEESGLSHGHITEACEELLVCPGEGAAPMQDDLVLQKEEMDTRECRGSHVRPCEAKGKDISSRSMSLDVARCRSTSLDVARCRSMSLDVARRRSMSLYAKACSCCRSHRLDRPPRLNNSASWKSLQDYVGQVVRQMLHASIS
eukprot:Skav207284  [mRNA]  locus=scaffold434:179440:181132:- [translate_table: standard]